MKYLRLSLIIALLALMTILTNAQDMMNIPTVEVNDQLSLNGQVVIDAVYSEGYGFIVIHTDNGEHNFGEVIGSRSIKAGWNYNVAVKIDTDRATPSLFAMLHEDKGEIGVYEFAGEGTPDGPVIDGDGNIITPHFHVNVIHAYDQFVENNTVIVRSVTSQVDGWLVVHAGDAENFGDVLGAVRVDAGITSDVVVELNGTVSDVVWPMLHVNTGDPEQYEFVGEGTPDGPVVVNGNIATLPIWTVPHLRVSDQNALPADNASMMMDTPAVTIDSALSDGEGWLIVHADVDGTFGPVVGMARLAPGLNTDVTLELSDDATPILWPMLHTNTGDLEQYEFAGEGTPDQPIVIDGEIVTFPIYGTPSIVYNGTIDDDGIITIPQAQIEAHGWLIIHADADGSFGEVLGMAPLTSGVNTDIQIQVDGLSAGDTVWPMLHYDTGELGYYGFAGADTEDDPVFLNGEIVTAPMILDVANSMEAGN